MTFLNVFKHLLPNARAWRLTVSKQLRQLFEGLSGLADDVQEFFDEVFSDIDPDQTRELSAWEFQFGLPDVGQTEADRRTRLAAAWEALGGQSPRYIQDTLRNSGFDVYVHEWWVPGTEPAVGVQSCVTARNPNAVLLYPRYPLVNIILESAPNLIVLAGEAAAEAGEPSAEAGNYDGFVETRKEYTLPSDPNEYPYFLYIGAQTFGDLATVDASRKDEFEALCLKICPCHAWLGMIVQYV